MAQYRAIESRRPDALFKDPLAEKLSGQKGTQVATHMKGFGRYASWTLSIRTLMIDRMIESAIDKGVTKIVNLGAGLDTRPYRLKIPKEVLWIEVDFQDVIQFKERTLKTDKPLCQLIRIACDLSNSKQRQEALTEISNLQSNLNSKKDESERTLVLTEGVIPYLEEAQVVELATDVKNCKGVRFWITEYLAPAAYPRFQHPRFIKRMGGSPFKFFPKDWLGLLSQCGWKAIEQEFLYDLGLKLKRPFPLPWYVKLVTRFAPPEKVLEQTRVSAYLLLES